MIRKKNNKKLSDLELSNEIQKKKQLIRKTNSGKELNKLLNELLKSSSKKKKKIKKYTGFPRAKLYQKCVVKLSYISGTEDEKMKKHLAFLKQYLPQKNKKGVEKEANIFTYDESLSQEDAVKTYIDNITPDGFRLIFSPDSEKVPIEAAVRTFMRKLENITGYKLYWLSAKHTDTNKTHCHILINGKDRFGKKVFFPPEIIKSEMRKIACTTCTEYAGYRTQEDLDEEKKKLLKARYYTTIDTQLSLYEKEIVDETYESEIEVNDDYLLKRMSTLQDLGFARRVNSGLPRKYQLEKKWKEKLKTLGRYNSFNDAREDLKYVDSVNLIQYQSEMGKITGIITGLYKMNYEDSWTNAIRIENKSQNMAWYVPLTFEPKNILLNTTVSLNVRRNSKGKLTPNIDVLDWNRG